MREVIPPGLSITSSPFTRLLHQSAYIPRLVVQLELVSPRRCPCSFAGRPARFFAPLRVLSLRFALQIRRVTLPFQSPQLRGTLSYRYAKDGPPVTDQRHRTHDRATCLDIAVDGEEGAHGSRDFLHVSFECKVAGVEEFYLGMRDVAGEDAFRSGVCEMK